nr:hypothetical protein [uncultured Prevotella sp.]
MAKLTLKNFIEFTNTDGKLIKAVKRQYGYGWDDFQDYLKNVSNSPYGAAGGFSGFIYYSETSDFWRRNRKIITEQLSELAFSLGENMLQMVMSFRGVKDSDFSEDEVGCALYGNYNSDLDQIYKVFAWFALEEVASWYSDFEYENR